MSVFVGIDVAKATLAVAVWPAGECREFANDARGHAALKRRLERLGVARILLEATGGYEQALVSALAPHWPVVRIAPHRARAFATAMGTLAKTDPIDAAMLARLAAIVEGPVVVPPTPEALRLQALVRRRTQVVGQRDDERRRLPQASDATVRGSIRRMIRLLEAEIVRLDREIEQQLPACDVDRVHRLRAVPGIGTVTTATLIAFLPELGTLGNREIAALVGLAPYNADSGQRSGTRRCRGGRGTVRRVLYMATWSAIRTQADFNARYAALRARGKHAKVALTACMRVLLTRLNAMLRSNADWRPSAA
jgi:transposase